MDLLRKYIKQVILLENSSGKRGIAYESLLVSELQRNPRIDVGPPAGNNPSISDIDVIVNGIGVAFEVKLSPKDLLGKIRKNHFKSLTWDGEEFSGDIKEESSLHNIINAMLLAMNSSTVVLTKMKKIQEFIIPFKPLPWDLLSSFGRDDGTNEEKSLYAIMRNDPRFKIPAGYPPVPTKQITRGNEVQITSNDIRQIIGSKNGSNNNKTHYIIVGNNSLHESGQIYSLGNGDPLTLNAPLFDPGPVNIEIRFQGAGGSKDGRRFSFGFDTRGGGNLGAGIKFGPNCSLSNTLLKQCSPQVYEKGDDGAS